jgi:hypothetical protein
VASTGFVSFLDPGFERDKAEYDYLGSKRLSFFGYSIVKRRPDDTVYKWKQAAELVSQSFYSFN